MAWNGRRRRRRPRIISRNRPSSPKSLTATQNRSMPMSESAATNPLAAPPAHRASPSLHHQFEELEQQYDASNFGMWVFLATKGMFFCGLFTAYIIYRSIYYPGFVAGSHGLECY